MSDAIIIPGHSIDAGGEPGEWLLLRLREGLRLYSEGYGEYVIVSGGKGPGDQIEVALSMKAWLMDNGVEEGFIIVEDSAANTYENFQFSKALVAGQNYDIHSIVIVTNDFHIYRCTEIGELFFDQVSASSAQVAGGMRKILAYLKEPFSIIKYRVLNQLPGSYLL